MKRCSQSTLAVAPAPGGPSTSGTHVCDQYGKSFTSRFEMSLHIKNNHLEESMNARCARKNQPAEAI